MHMSETQDATDLAEAIVSLDNACRDEANDSETAHSFASVEAYSAAGKFLGTTGINEDEALTLHGVDLNEHGELRVIMRSDDPDPTAPAKYHLTPVQLEASYPATFDYVESLVRANTDNFSLGSLGHQIYGTLGGKHALAEVVRTYLKEGRRAALEGRAEADEIASQDFYAAQDGFGQF
jgi:hypothetical protein